jgi:UDP:flavonoid glycosyltransferase YjiC (YdhE family)
VCPIDWGLGHASRDIPLIRKLLGKNVEVILGGDGSSLEFLKIEFPYLEVIRIPSHKFIYSKIFPAWFMIIVQIPAFLKGIIIEHRFLKKIIHSYHIDLVISDARYGLWSRQILSVILTHQIRIKMPWFFKAFEYPVNYINRIALGKFSQIWIPDLPGHINLSGMLSHNITIPSDSLYTGFLSGFQKNTITDESPDKFEVVLLLSGPEPQRSVLEKRITAQLLKENRKSLVIGGKTGDHSSEDLSESCKRVSFLSGYTLYNILKNARYIICKSGYSTIMDLVTIGKTAFMIPTPGQTEQEYLACFLQQQGLFLFSRQKDFNLRDAIRRFENFRPKDFPRSEESLIDEALNRLFQVMERTGCKS